MHEKELPVFPFIQIILELKNVTIDVLAAHVS